VECNEKASALYGVPKPEIIGLNLAQISPGQHRMGRIPNKQPA